MKTLCARPKSVTLSAGFQWVQRACRILKNVPDTIVMIDAVCRIADGQTRPAPIGLYLISGLRRITPKPEHGHRIKPCQTLISSDVYIIMFGADNFAILIYASYATCCVFSSFSRLHFPSSVTVRPPARCACVCHRSPAWPKCHQTNL